MNGRKISGIVLLIIGIVLIIISIYGKKKMQTAQGHLDDTYNYLPKGKTLESLEGKMSDYVGKYNIPLNVCLAGGILLVLIGGGLTMKKRHRK